MDYLGGTGGSRVDRPQWTTPTETLDTEFKRRYPPEVLGDEMVSNARVWKVYRDEATTHDTVMLDGWSKTVDVLLIFAGLFSAVVTAFLVESYKLLKPDNSAAYMSTALYLLVSGSNASTSSLPAPPPISSLVTPGTRWTNGLWFTSLLLSLGVALLCILVKQWIGEYTARNGASATDPLHWALRRQLYYQAMTAWPVSELVSVLPALLHLSLFLFSAGIAGFLWDLDRALGIWVSILSVSLGIFYAGCTLLPLWIPECPTSTPLISILRRISRRIRVLVLKAFVIIQTSLLPWSQPFLLPWQHKQIPSTAVSFDGIHIARQSASRSTGQHGVLTWQEKLRLYDTETNTSAVDVLLHSRLEQLRADSLLWLIFSVPHHDAATVGLQAIGGLREECSALDRLRADDRFTLYDWGSAYLDGEKYNQPLQSARIVRSMLRIKHPFALPPQTVLDKFWWLFYRISDSESPDLRFLWSFYTSRYIEAFKHGDSITFDGLPYYAQSATVTWTIMAVIHAVDLDLKDLLEALARCSFHVLSPSTVNIVLDRVYALSPGTLIRCRNGPPNVALLDLLCQMILMPSMSTSTLQHLIASIATSTFGVPPYDASWLLYDFPFLAKYLGSTLYIQQQPGGTTPYLSRVLLKLVEEASLGYYRGQGGARRLFQAITATLYMSNRAGLLHNGIVASCCSDVLDRYVYRMEYTGGAPAYEVQSILQPLDLPGLSLSLWGILSENSTGYAMLRLADMLARALLFMDDGSTTPETDLFLSSLRLRNLLEIWHRSVKEPDWESYGTTVNCLDRFLIFHTIQHCVDLRPMWWFDSLRLIHEGRMDDLESVKQSIHEIETVMSQRGPCRTCLLRGWYEWDPPSTCTSNPAGCYFPDSSEIRTTVSASTLTTENDGLD